MVNDAHMAGPGTGGKLPQDFDVIVIGAGPAGVAAAMALLDAGKSVLVLERGPLHPPKLPETLMVETALSLRLSAIVQSAT
ncbi:MAG TPA: FAD-dependent oxidoreductase, partial [Candidatus Angelobacter sp.]|nr:FAD-dependent oxidoreductase [Candidatus Angelobacter sp.]